jgi:adenosylcobyric acid synthase
MAIEGYEIHNGRTSSSKGKICRVMPSDLAWQNAQGNILGIYLHGLFENPDILRALFGGVSISTLDTVFDGLADFVDRHFEPGVLKSLISEEG